MPMSINEAQLAGNLGRDPEIRSMQNGENVAINLSIATNEVFYDRNRERQERTEWHRVTVFSEANKGLAKLIETYCKKGTSVFVRGKIQTRKWQDQSGQDRYTTEIVVAGPQALFKLNDGGGQQQDGQQRQAPRGDRAQQGPAASPPGPPADDDLDDDIPF